MEHENLNRSYYLINWELVSKAINFYKGLGYEYIEVPWLVSEEAMNVTFSGHYLRGSFPALGHNGLVGSAEQSFIQLMLDNKLEPRNYCAATPCFRFAETEDEIHQKYFFKVELIRVFSNYLNYSFYENELNICIQDAQKLFKNCFGLDISTDVANDGIVDIMLNGLEIGSYGIREYKNNTWVYGTGLAEPRLSMAMNKVKQND